jgi:hypothetical protein
MALEDLLVRRPKALPREVGADPGVLWLDPGGTTGWCIITVHPDALLLRDVPVLLNISHCAAGHIGGKSEPENIRAIMSLIEEWPGLTVGVESFRLRSRVASSELLSPVRITSVVEYGCWLDRRLVLRQTPETAKSAFPDERLCKLGFYRGRGVGGKGDDSAGGRLSLSKMGLEGDHAYDALRHALAHLKRCKEQPWRAKRVLADGGFA